MSGKLEDITFDELITQIKSLEKRNIVITGRTGTGKTAIALKIAETLNKSFNVANNFDFCHGKVIVNDLVIKICPSLLSITHDEVKTYGLWLTANYVFRNVKQIDTQVDIIQIDPTFDLVGKYQTTIPFPSQAIYDEYKKELLNFLENHFSKAKEVK